MNIMVSPVYDNVNNAASFGAEFTEKGYQLAKQHADVYEPFYRQNEFEHPEFFRKVPMLLRAPFTKYFVDNTDKPFELAETIVKYGATDNIISNSMFIQQLLETEKYIHRLDEYSRVMISTAVNEVLKKNWDNGELSQKDTLRLLEMAKYSINEETYKAVKETIKKANTQ